MNNGKPVYGIIGNPVAHSLSPLMHNTAFRELKVDAEYRLFPLKEEELERFLSNLRQKDSPIFGLNVTVPYKERVVPYMDYLSPFAQKTGAVNTIGISKEREVRGFNTDGPGFLAHLAELAFDTTGKRIVILGAGGTARAIVTALFLLPERPHSIRIYNRHKEKADLLVSEVGRLSSGDFIESVARLEDLDREPSDLLINATPLGLKTDDPCPVIDDVFHPDMLVYDVIYNPKETTFLKRAKNKGARIANGLGMLFYQGVLAFQHWADIQLDERVKRKMWESIT